ncbi:MAG TPA: hypothetical protein VGO00_15395 [Kofleriaceae bacterium]|nr:hypothetical protein [Kofleriaceae bacterium]
MSPAPRWRRLLAGGLAIAVADTLLFSAFWWPRGVAPDRIFRGIAAGLFGHDAAEGGLAMTFAGMFLHTLNATMFVLVYAIVAREVPALRRNPWLWGPPYGLVVWAGMTFVVVPLSRIGYHGLGEASWVVTSLVFHATVVGVVAAWCSRDA